VLAWASFYVFTAVVRDDRRGQPERRPAARRSSAPTTSTVALLAVAFLVAVVAPVAEEFFFRGSSSRALQELARAVAGRDPHRARLRRDPRQLGRLGVSCCRSRSSASSLCLLYEKTGSLYPGIAVHCANNSIAFGATQDWTWQIPCCSRVARA
jgi:membrane protease YdiL (CAAX protease family)